MLPTASFSKDALLSQTEGQVSHDFFEASAYITIASITPNRVLFPYRPTHKDTRHEAHNKSKQESGIHTLLIMKIS